MAPDQGLDDWKHYQNFNSYNLEEALKYRFDDYSFGTSAAENGVWQYRIKRPVI